MKLPGVWFALVLWVGMSSQTARPSAQTESVAVFAGTIVHSSSGKPLDGVHVTLTPSATDGGTSVIYGAMSNAQGRFSISDLPAEVYSISLEKRGFIFTLSGKKGPGALGEVRLKAGERRNNVVLTMIPRAIIAGRVLDEYGDPIKDVSISAIPLEFSKAVMPESVITDDRGEFRISAPPGRYYVQGRLWSFNEDSFPSPDGPAIRGIATTYYPGVPGTQDAAVVEAAPGRVASNVEIRLQHQAAFFIVGKVKGIPDGVSRVSVYFESDVSGQDSQQVSVPRFYDGPSLPEADFGIGPLKPGVYRIYAGGGTGEQEFQSQATEVTLSDSTVQNVELLLVPGTEVDGIIKMAGRRAPGPGQREGFTVELTPEGSADSERRRTAQSAADGSFRISNVFAKRYYFRLVPLPEDTFIQSVTINGVPADGNFLDFSGGAEGATVRIVVNGNGARLSGKVLEGKGGSPVQGAGVLLFPDLDDEEAAARESRQIIAGADGAYSFRGLAPGRFRLLAAESGLAGLSLIEAWIRRDRATAAIVELKEGERTVKDVPLEHEVADEPQK